MSTPKTKLKVSLKLHTSARSEIIPVSTIDNNKDDFVCDKTLKLKIKVNLKPKDTVVISNVPKVVFKNHKYIYDSQQTILRFDSTIIASYYPQFVDPDTVLSHLIQIPFRQVTYMKYGKLMKTPRLTYCYGQFQGESTAKYRGKSFYTEAIPNWLMILKNRVESLTQRLFNAVILNQYQNGDQHISWHADSEPFLDHQMIASCTIAQPRDFQFRVSMTDPIREICLENGSLLLFDEGLMHCLPKRKNQNQTRFNITFRCVKNSMGMGNYYYYNRGQSEAIV